MKNLEEYQEEPRVEDDDLVEQLISNWIFFSPSPELTRLILLQNDKLGTDYFHKHFQGGIDSLLGDQKNPLESLRKAADILFQRSAQTEPESQSEEEVISDFQAFFSERIFNHLALLSRTPYARTGTYSIREELTIEMAGKIGLGLYLHEKTSSDLRDETEKILVQLAREFQYWFIKEHEGIFHTVWGSILSGENEGFWGEIRKNSIIFVPDVEEPA